MKPYICMSDLNYRSTQYIYFPGREEQNMKIYSVNDPEFKEYGHVADGYEAEKRAIMDALAENTPCPEEGTGYVPKEAAIQNLDAAKKIAPSLFGGIPVEFGWCNGHNTKLNCLEYHRNSEFNLGTEDFILLLAKQSDMTDWRLDTKTVKAFRVPAGTLVEVYATTFHYAPCQASKDKGFRVLVALPEEPMSEHARQRAGHPKTGFSSHRISGFLPTRTPQKQRTAPGSGLQGRTSILRMTFKRNAA